VVVQRRGAGDRAAAGRAGPQEPRPVPARDALLLAVGGAGAPHAADAARAGQPGPRRSATGDDEVRVTRSRGGARIVQRPDPARVARGGGAGAREAAGEARQPAGRARRGEGVSLQHALPRDDDAEARRGTEPAEALTADASRSEAA